MDREEQREQLEKLMEEYGTPLLRMCTVYLRDAHLAQDAVQEHSSRHTGICLHFAVNAARNHG